MNNEIKSSLSTGEGWGEALECRGEAFTVIGISDSRCPSLPSEAMDDIRRTRVFSGGKRHHDIVAPMLPEYHVWIDIKTPLDDVFDQYQRYDEHIVVFASGDPLFFGFANTLRRRLPDAAITLFPSFNSLQTLAHRLLMEYDDMRIVSLTGRPWQEFDRALIERATKIGVLTDNVHTPTAIAERMAEYGYTDYEMTVGEQLGNSEKERITTFSVSSIINDEVLKNRLFQTPNCIILKSTDIKPRRFGLPDEEFALLDGRERMITKMPIRLLTLQALELCRRSVFFDIGFCTGSVSIEARLQFPTVSVYAFEIRPEGQRLIDTNARRFGAPGIEVKMGDFIGADLSPLPRPDAVFIGGHGGRLAEMMERIVPILADGGCIVLNSVTETSKKTFVETAQRLNLHLEKETQITLNDYNKITILKATK